MWESRSLPGFFSKPQAEISAWGFFLPANHNRKLAQGIVSAVRDPRWRLAITSVLALVVFRLVDRGIFVLSERRVPALAVGADLRFTSLLLLCGLVLTTNARAVLGLPRGDLRREVRLVPWILGWLGATVISVHIFGVGRVGLPRWQDVFAFSVTGPIAEELLIRGLVLTAAECVWPPVGLRPGKAVYFSAAVFSGMHLQYHAFRIDLSSCLQLAWTFPLGILLGWIVERTHSIWPSLAVHLVNNALVLLV